jgi:hypothetical protein
MQGLPFAHSLNLPELSRRREPRIEVAGVVTAYAGSPRTPEALAVHDLSFRGFGSDTVTAVVPGTVACYRFETRGAQPVTLHAVAVHCHRLDGTPERWRTGWEFPQQAGLDQGVEHLLDVAVGVLTVE